MDASLPRQDRATLRPKDAATLVLVKRDGATPSVLLGQRHSGHVFMPNRYVFPGGRVDPNDHRVPAATELRDDVALCLRRSATAPRARALAIAAIRETFEETGLLLGKPAATEGLARQTAPWPAFAAHGLAPALDALDYIFRAITPPQRPRRFNARFFMADADLLRGEIRSDGELQHIHWVPVDDALQLPLPKITIQVLAEVAGLVKLDDVGRTRRHVPLYHRVRGRDSFEQD